MVLLSPLSPLSLLFIFSLLLLAFTDPCSTQNTTDYLKLPLLHRTLFPSPSEALSSDAHRLSVLFSALHGRKTPKLPLISGASTGSGQYFVDLSLGTPPQRLLLVADTGSDLVWVTCSACRGRCDNHPPGSAFLARHSTTFSPHHCFNSPCRLVPHPKLTRCKHTRLHSPCRYEYSYADGSTTAGFFSRETTAFNTSSGRVVKHKTLSFGCAFSVSGPSVSGPSFNGAHGVMGLGRGPISLASQLGHRFGNKFSYCLMDYTLSPSPTSYLMIGGSQNAVVKGNSKLSFTPFQINPLSPTFYYIGIQSVSIDDVKLHINPMVWSIDELGNGGTVVDSGTTLTFLADPAYRRILSAFRQRVKLPSPADPTLGFDLCVNVSGVSRPSLPRLSFKFAGESVFRPPPRNYFVDTADGVKCLAIQPVSSPAGFSVIGNLMQQGYLFEFDKDRSRLGFSRHGCAVP
ncbi:aspartic proteinase NANA, chloroplast [Cornus florida]|uniref:aspartic proteinase NANA, chloroplast n=1 Tax=Cornus florida TaxID=4283 RepID=UPI0028991CCD|nr:aspartic proteinase NANA, chloroplast [Cornus florida]